MLTPWSQPVRVCMRTIHPPDNIQNDGRPGGEFLSNAHWLGPWRQHFDDESWRDSGYSSRPSVCLILCCGFGVTVIRHENADAMVLASALMRGIHPPDNNQNGDVQGHGVSILMTNHGVELVTLFWLSQPPVYLYSVPRWSY
jgi:hypothetical protein